MLTDEDIEFFYPHLAQIGFGSHQVQQIVDRLAQIGKSPERVFEGMEHADFELAQGPLVGAGGQPVDKPLGYVFGSLAKTGYYRRPQNFVSAEEQAEIDAAEEAKRLREVRKRREEAEFEAWRAGLTPEEVENALRGKPGRPGQGEEAWLKNIWRTQVKPRGQQGER
jgi:hypothetical protein